MTELLQITPQGLYCPQGGFHVDPWQAVRHAVISHAHSDHARWGSMAYLTAEPGVDLLRERVGAGAFIESIPYGEPVMIRGVEVSLHPAGHILGSSQIRVAWRGEVCVVSGDYKLDHDPTCAPFEPVACHTFITESTFALPVFRWPAPQETFDEMNAWWRANQEQGRTSVVFAYAVGKAQRILASVDASIGPILVHGAVSRFLPAYESAGVALPKVEKADEEHVKLYRGKALVVAPPSAAQTPWMRKLGPVSTAFASGWMQLRGARRRRAADRGFVISDHADWDGLLKAIGATGAQNIGVTHGYAETLARWLREKGKYAYPLATLFQGEVEDEFDTAAGA